MHHDAIIADVFAQFNLSEKHAQLAVSRPAGATATRKREHAQDLILWISGKPPGAFEKCVFTVVPGASFFYDVALHDCYIVLLSGVYHFVRFPLGFSWVSAVTTTVALTDIITAAPSQMLKGRSKKIFQKKKQE